MHCWETRIYNTSAELPSAGKMLHYHGNTRGLLLHRRLGNLYRAYDVTYASGQHCGRLYVVHYVLVKVWLCPSVLYVLPVLIETYEIWGLFPPECPLFVVGRHLSPRLYIPSRPLQEFQESHSRNLLTFVNLYIRGVSHKIGWSW